MNILNKTTLIALSFALLALSGCASIGPGTVVKDSFDYTGVLSDSWKQRMLINMVRLRYGDAPVFLEVASVINQYSLETGVNISGQLARTGAGDTFVGIGGHGTYTDRPTITYMPLSGEKFARSLMRPLPPSAVVGMIESGYPINLVLRVCVESLNGIRNRKAGLLGMRPADAEFYPLLDKMQRIQDSGAIGLRISRANEAETIVMTMRDKADQSVLEESLSVRKTLGLNPKEEEIRVFYGSMAKNDKELAILTRSILQIINNLASNIQVPEAHVAEKIVNPTAPDMGAAGAQEAPLIRIMSSSARPDNAFVAVPYQSYWFWIDNRDLKSKGLFSFLMFLFSLTETSGKEGAPVVTISAGG